MGAYNTSFHDNMDRKFSNGIEFAVSRKRFQSEEIHKLAAAMEEFCRGMSYWILHATIFFLFYQIISFTTKETIKWIRHITRKKQPKPNNLHKPDDIQILRRRPGTAGPTSV